MSNHGFRGMVCALLLAMLSVTGCVKIDSTLDVAKDGSGTWKVIYAMPVHIIRQMESAQAQAQELEKAGGRKHRPGLNRMADLPYLFDEESVRQRFRKLETQGIVLAKIQTRSSGGWRYVDLTVKYTQLEALLRQPFFDSLGVALSGAGSGACKLVVGLPDMGTVEDLPDPADPKVSAKVSPFMNGMRVVSRIGVPGDIRNTTSQGGDVRHATWEWDYDKDSRAVLRLARDKMIVVFDGSGTTLRDFSKSALRE